jgi:hypothetical protein
MKHFRAQPGGHLGRTIAGSVVHHDRAVVERQGPEYTGQGSGFVEAGEHHVYEIIRHVNER